MMELPPYHVPTLRGVLLRAWDRVRLFVKEAGQVIVLMVIALNVLNSLGTDGSFGNEDSEHSVLSETARAVTPLFAPMGLREDNWPAVVGVFSGVLAKEVVVGTLDNLYTRVANQGASLGEPQPFDLEQGLRDAAATVPANLAELSDALLDPLGFEQCGCPGLCGTRCRRGGVRCHARALRWPGRGLRLPVVHPACISPAWRPSVRSGARRAPPGRPLSPPGPRGSRTSLRPCTTRRRPTVRIHRVRWPGSPV